MKRVSSRILAQTALASLAFSLVTAEKDSLASSQPPAQPSRSAAPSSPAVAPKSANPSNVNPLRAAANGMDKSSPSGASAAIAPAATLDLAAPAAAPAKRAGTESFVPNTGPLRLFRSADKPVTAPATRTPRGQLFPQGPQQKIASSPVRVMRYEDVAAGAALVPLAPRPASQSPGSVTPSVPTSPPAAPAPRESEPQVQRLPPVDRTLPRPQLPAGVKLPQEPIEIYPETGK